jgi:hypothetical protein
VYTKTTPIPQILKKSARALPTGGTGGICLLGVHVGFPQASQKPMGTPHKVPQVAEWPMSHSIAKTHQSGAYVRVCVTYKSPIRYIQMLLLLLLLLNIFIHYLLI